MGMISVGISVGISIGGKLIPSVYVVTEDFDTAKKIFDVMASLREVGMVRMDHACSPANPKQCHYIIDAPLRKAIRLSSVSLEQILNDEADKQLRTMLQSMLSDVLNLLKKHGYEPTYVSVSIPQFDLVEEWIWEHYPEHYISCKRNYWRYKNAEELCHCLCSVTENHYDSCYTLCYNHYYYGH
jgi:hypothetical protein